MNKGDLSLLKYIAVMMGLLTSVLIYLMLTYPDKIELTSWFV